MDHADLYGRGIGFPPRIAPDGQLVWSTGELNVRESIAIILRTRPGERLLRPDFGCGLDRYLYEPNNVATLRLIQEEIKQAITRWEPRVSLDDIRVATSAEDERAVEITIVYTLIATQRRERMGLTLALQV
ncbi:GPW/gp25 family protein [Chloroflexia bacterium SDU3-3]|nr:GPW/gp25 family protein [Chloroflexia bacterium SDU3-3]